MRNIIYRNPRHRSRQKGAITMFSAVLILILLTEMIIYAVQVGVFEQRKSSNEMKQKLAFHTADSAIQVAKQFMSANATLASSAIVDKRPTERMAGWRTLPKAVGSRAVRSPAPKVFTPALANRWPPCEQAVITTLSMMT